MSDLYNAPQDSADAVRQLCQIFDRKVSQLPEGEISSIQDVVELSAAFQSVLLYETFVAMRDRLFAEGMTADEIGEQVLRMKTHFTNTVTAGIEELMNREIGAA